MLDKDDQFRYSPVVNFNLSDGKFRLVMYPNPVRAHLTVEGLINEQPQTIRLVDQAGHLVYNKTALESFEVVIARVFAIAAGLKLFDAICLF